MIIRRRSLLSLALLLGVAATVRAEDDGSREFELAARLLFPKTENDFPAEDVFPVPLFAVNHPFRSVAVRMPLVYALDRDGGVYVYRVGTEDRETNLRPVKTIGDAGDGDDLRVFGDALVCTDHGGLQVYSLDAPEEPKYIGRVGPNGTSDYASSIVPYGSYAFVLGKNVICSYDMAQPTEPILLATTKTDRYGWTGCAVENFLYVGAFDTERNDRDGIMVCDITNPKDPQEVGFVTTTRTPYHLFPVPEKGLLASLDADTTSNSFTGANVQVHGNSAIFSTKDPARPALAGEFRRSGGRSATALLVNDQAYLVCEGVVFRISDSRLERVFSFFPGSTLDAFPYHGDSDGEYAAVVSDAAVFVLRSKNPQSKPD